MPADATTESSSPREVTVVAAGAAAAAAVGHLQQVLGHDHRQSLAAAVVDRADQFLLEVDREADQPPPPADCAAQSLGRLPDCAAQSVAAVAAAAVVAAVGGCPLPRREVVVRDPLLRPGGVVPEPLSSSPW